MAFITKISKDPLGEFTIKFSTRTGRFSIDNWPAEVLGKKIETSTIPLLSWDDVNKELDRIKDDYLHNVTLQRIVIVIQIKTSESDFMVVKKKWKSKDQNGFENVRASDFMEDSEGFELKWYIAEEYLYPRGALMYKIIEGNKNNRIDRKLINIKYQLFSEWNGEIRMITYRKDLHEFLKSMDQKISDMLKQMVAYFDIDEQKFLENIEKSKFNLLSLNE
jgi:hypothetical protein